MLVLDRYQGQAIRIGGNIRVVFMKCTDGRTVVGLDAPREIPIVREELLARDRKESGEPSGK